MGVLADLKLGYYLTKLTNIEEELWPNATSPIGANGGIDALPVWRQQQVRHQIPDLLFKLNRYPRHEVTKALLKNMQMAQGLGRTHRLHAMASLMDKLIKNGLALDPDVFFESFAD
ncbi:hypothetical protein IB234_23440 [Pseudomonas sp. PDM16]|uniref:hypothetical protein n=1 Tax=Pseudomonas sp. PDM16 TaxID=2769292 RepID=UPI00177AB9F0|nr:hypothetical protein [Pseudomonas sp. PDM16]MBD9417530.1 hypothetical protein [Pseudomonas sp. PDM16]